MNLGAWLEESGYLFVDENSFRIFLEEVLKEGFVGLHAGETDQLASSAQKLLLDFLLMHFEGEVVDEVGHHAKKPMKGFVS